MTDTRTEKETARAKGSHPAPSRSARPRTWHIYMIRCGDGTLYTGIATNVERRFKEHCTGGSRCAKYLRGRGPLSMVMTREIGSRQRALKAEAKIKNAAKRLKETMVDDPSVVDQWLSGMDVSG